MIRIYLDLAFRSLRKRKFHSGLNILGLAAGLTAFLLIAFWVEDELSYDSWINNSGRLCRIVTSINDSNGALELAMSPPALASSLLQIPGIEKVARMVGPGKSVVVRSGNKVFNEQDCYLADSTLLSLFSFRLLDGDPQTALASPTAVVFSESLARKYFGNGSAIGRRVSIEWYGSAVACVGFLGHATYAVEKRTKEIGIRKVLGASGWGIVGLLGKDFGMMIGSAGVLALPPSYVFAHKWLEAFDYRIVPTVWMYIAAVVAVLVVGLATVACQARRAAMTNPVEALRYE